LSSSSSSSSQSSKRIKGGRSSHSSATKRQQIQKIAAAQAASGFSLSDSPLMETLFGVLAQLWRSLKGTDVDSTEADQSSQAHQLLLQTLGDGGLPRLLRRFSASPSDHSSATANAVAPAALLMLAAELPAQCMPDLARDALGLLAQASFYFILMSRKAFALYCE
jgi:hypothetical protein